MKFPGPGCPGLLEDALVDFRMALTFDETDAIAYTYRAKVRLIPGASVLYHDRVPTMTQGVSGRLRRLGRRIFFSRS